MYTMTEDKSFTITGTPAVTRANVGPNSPATFYNESKTHKVPSSLSHSRTNSGEKDEYDAPSDDSGGVIRVPSGSGFRIMTPFPWRLHEILEDIENKGMDWIVGWTNDGKAFQVLDQENFEGTILPMYFRHSRYKSFQRQLYLYGFRSLQHNTTAKGAYHHPCFRRDDRMLCKKILRPKSASNPKTKTKRDSKPCKPANSKSQIQRVQTVASQMMIESSFDSFLEERGMAPLPSDTSLLQERGRLEDFRIDQSQYDGVVSPSLDSVENECPYGLGTHDILEDLKLGLNGLMPLQLLQRGESLQPVSSIVQDFQQHNPMFTGPVFSMSTSDSTFINVELPDETYSPPANVLSAGPSLISIQELEPFSDSIISLFGSQSEAR